LYSKLPIFIGITGPESTGKTWLAERLSHYFYIDYIPEYAREYLLNLKRPYTYDDVIKIAEKQWNLINNTLNTDQKIVIYDTEMLVIYVWLLYKYGKCPKWIEEAWRNQKIDLYLLCYPDIEWDYDPLRENPNDLIELFDIYETNLKKENKSYYIVKENREQRFINVLNYLKINFPHIF
jgi:nicotinamide riboside kinase